MDLPKSYISKDLTKFAKQKVLKTLITVPSYKHRKEGTMGKIKKQLLIVKKLNSICSACGHATVLFQK